MDCSSASINARSDPGLRRRRHPVRFAVAKLPLVAQTLALRGGRRVTGLRLKRAATPNGRLGLDSSAASAPALSQTQGPFNAAGSSSAEPIDHAATTNSCRSTRMRRRIPLACRPWRTIDRRSALAFASARERPARTAFTSSPKRGRERAHRGGIRNVERRALKIASKPAVLSFPRKRESKSRQSTLWTPAFAGVTIAERSCSLFFNARFAGQVDARVGLFARCAGPSFSRVRGARAVITSAQPLRGEAQPANATCHSCERGYPVKPLIFAGFLGARE
jgi:hypothetical protein